MYEYSTTSPPLPDGEGRGEEGEGQQSKQVPGLLFATLAVYSSVLVVNTLRMTDFVFSFLTSERESEEEIRGRRRSSSTDQRSLITMNSLLILGRNTFKTHLSSTRPRK